MVQRGYHNEIMGVVPIAREMREPLVGAGATQRHVRHRRAPRWRGPAGERGVIVRVIINGTVNLVMKTEGTG